MFTFRSCAQACVLGLWLTTGAASAQPVQFVAVDIVDAQPGVDLWRYDYVSSGALGEFEGFTLLFDRNAYAGLSLVAPPPAGAFDAAVAQPNIGLSVDGLLSLTAQRSIGAGEAFSFSVRFARLGTGTPGSQPFERYADDLHITGSGVTSAVPEPATIALLLAGLVAVGLRVRRE